MSTLILYSTLGCHLCELAKQQVEPLLPAFSLTLEEVDIANDDNLLTRYGISIPVITIKHGLQELCWPFDEAEARAFLENNLC